MWRDLCVMQKTKALDAKGKRQVLRRSSSVEGCVRGCGFRVNSRSFACTPASQERSLGTPPPLRMTSSKSRMTSSNGGQI